MLASTQVHNNILFIMSVRCDYVICSFKSSSSLKSELDGPLKMIIIQFFSVGHLESGVSFANK